MRSMVFRSIAVRVTIDSFDVGSNSGSVHSRNDGTSICSSPERRLQSACAGYPNFHYTLVIMNFLLGVEDLTHIASQLLCVEGVQV